MGSESIAALKGNAGCNMKKTQLKRHR